METKNAENGAVYWTENYEMFISLSGNRSLNHNHVKKLKNLIINGGWRKSSLIIVNSNLTVYDGQHRLQALKEIKRETGKSYNIGYQIDNQLTISKTQTLNSAVLPWKPEDYIESNIKSGNKNYQFIRDLMKEHNMPYTAVLSILESVNGSITTEMFRSGKVIIDKDNEQMIWYNASCIQMIKPYFNGYNSRSFVSAMCFFLSKKNFCFDDFLSKLQINRSMLYPVTTISKYKELIQSIYNYRRRDKITFIQA
jgi:hypothetical protein